MKDKQNQKVAVGIVAAFFGPVLIGLLFQLSEFTILVIAGVLIVGVAAFVLLWPQSARPPLNPFPESARSRNADEEDDEPRPVRKKAPEPTKKAVEAVLPSNKDGYNFRFTATMAWLPEQGVEHDDRCAVAARSIFTRAGRVTEQFALTEREDALNSVRAALGSAQRDDDGVVLVSASDIELDTDAEDEDRLRRLTDLSKRSEEFDRHSNYYRHVRTYFYDEALKTPGSTLMLWLARNGFDFDEAERRLDTFARISAVAQDREAPARPAGGVGARFVAAGTPTAPGPGRSHPAATLIDALLPSATDDERGMFADDLARLLDEHGAADSAGRLRSGYGLQDVGSDSVDDGPEQTGPEQTGPEQTAAGAIEGRSAGETPDGPPADHGGQAGEEPEADPS